MSDRDGLTTGVVFLCVAAVLGVSQLEAGGQRFLFGVLLALPWALGGAAILKSPRVGAWLGLAIATVSVGASGWIISQSNIGQGRAIAELLFASPEGYFSWWGVAFATFLFGVAALWCAGAAIRLLLRARRGRARAHV